MDSDSAGFATPTITDYGDLVELTAGGELIGTEDAGTKFSLLDVSDGQLP